MRKLTGKVAIVTGASKGIGAALAKGLAAAGAAVAVNYAADKAGAERTVTEMTSHGGKAIAIQADVSKAADVQRMFEETTHVFGAVDVLVNNAGVFQSLGVRFPDACFVFSSPNAQVFGPGLIPRSLLRGDLHFEPFEAVTAQEFHREFDTNVLGPILTIQEALKHFPASGGSIINISSIASENPVPHSSLYAATKGAIDTLTLALAKELGPRNIRVNAVAPGHTETEVSTASGLWAASTPSRW